MIGSPLITITMICKDHLKFNLFWRSVLHKSNLVVQRNFARSELKQG